MKKILALALVLTMVLAFAACNAGNNTNTTTGTTTAPTTPTTNNKDEGTMSYAEYIAAELDAKVVVECYVQAKQGWWDNKIKIYAQDPDGAYFIYDMTCTEEEAAQLVPGTKIKVTGYKAAYKGEVEIIDCSFEIMEGNWIAPATDVTALLADESLIDYQNRFMTIKGAEVAPSYNADGVESAFLYNWDGSGESGNDLYFNIIVAGKTYNMCVESYLCGKDTDVYKAVEALQIGDFINLEGFLYWYDGVNPHITAVTEAADPSDKSEGTMSYAEYAAAALDDEVVVECFVQAKQGWWDNKIKIYAQDPDGAYFIYDMTCTEEEAALLVPGTKIKVTGYKAAYKGEVEIIDSTFEIVDGFWLAGAVDVTELLADASLIDYQNRFMTITGATVAPSYNGDGVESAFLYNWDGSGEPGNDLYFNITVDGNTYNMCVESYLCGKDTDVYKAVEALKVGDTINLEGFLYWYDGVNPHITAVTAAE